MGKQEDQSGTPDSCLTRALGRIAKIEGGWYQQKNTRKFPRYNGPD